VITVNECIKHMNDGYVVTIYDGFYYDDECPVCDLITKVLNKIEKKGVFIAEREYDFK